MARFARRDGESEALSVRTFVTVSRRIAALTRGAVLCAGVVTCMLTGHWGRISSAIATGLTGGSFSDGATSIVVVITFFFGLVSGRLALDSLSIPQWLPSFSVLGSLYVLLLLMHGG